MQGQTISNYMAEQTYLGTILLDPELIKEAKVTEEMFSAIEHQAIYRNMQEIIQDDNPLDIQSLMIRMYENGSMQIIQNIRSEGVGYITDLAGSVPTTQNFSFYGKLIIESYRIREAQKEAQKILTLTGDEGDSEIVYESLSNIQNVMMVGVEKKNDLKETLVQVYDELESGATMGTPTGYTEYDRMTLGTHKGDLVIVAARPSVGKTAFCLNVGANQAEQKNPDGSYKNHVHIFSLEMPEKQLVRRMLGTYGRINAQNIRSGQMTDEDWGKMAIAMGHFSNLSENLSIYDDAVITVPDIRSKVLAAIREFPERDHIVIIDYLQLLTYHGRSNDNQTVKVGEISKALKQMAKELDISVTALSQLSRAVEQRQDKRPMLSDIRESGGIEQDADNVVFLYRDDYYDRESENKNIIELIIAKQRNGPVGTVSLAFIKEYGCFVSLERRFDNPS